MTELDGRCRLCGSEVVYKFSLRLVAGLKGRYCECKNCRMLQSHHLDRMSPSELEAKTESAPCAELDSGAAWRLSCVARRLELLAKLRILAGVRQYRKTLDFGCGTGFLVSYLAHRFGGGAIGYEPYSTPAFAKDKVFADWDAVAQKGPYHLVVASEVFEHFIHPREELIRIRNVLASDAAYVYVTTGLYIPGRTDSTWKYLAPQSGHHVSFYARQTMKQVALLLGASGVYQAGANYEWLFVLGKHGRGLFNQARLGLTSTALGIGSRLGLVPVIE